MPVYFAYGSNLDRIGMARRCPGAAPIGLGRCPGYGFFIMAEGYASVRRDPTATVHGLLWSVSERDLVALDAYEEVGLGLYGRAVVAVERADGSRGDALTYIGGNDRSGVARPGYMELVIAAALANDLPGAYCNALRRWLPPEHRDGP